MVGVDAFVCVWLARRAFVLWKREHTPMFMQTYTIVYTAHQKMHDSVSARLAGACIPITMRLITVVVAVVVACVFLFEKSESVARFGLLSSDDDVPCQEANTVVTHVAPTFNCSWVFGDFMNFGGGSICELSHSETNHFGSGKYGLYVHGNLVNLIFRKIVLTYNIGALVPPPPSNGTWYLDRVYLGITSFRDEMSISNDEFGIYTTEGVFTSTSQLAGLIFPVVGTSAERWFSFLDDSAVQSRGLLIDEYQGLIRFRGPSANTARGIVDTFNTRIRSYIELTGEDFISRVNATSYGETELVSFFVECTFSTANNGQTLNCYENVFNLNSLERRAEFSGSDTELFAVWRQDCNGTCDSVAPPVFDDPDEDENETCVCEPSPPTTIVVERCDDTRVELWVFLVTVGGSVLLTGIVLSAVRMYTDKSWSSNRGERQRLRDQVDPRYRRADLPQPPTFYELDGVRRGWWVDR